MDIAIAFLALTATIGAILLLAILGHKLREPKYRAAWAQLSTMIGGTYSSKMGAMSYRYKISGHYQGIPVEAFIETFTPEEDPNIYNYHMRIKTGVGRQDWAIGPKHTQAPDASRSCDGENGDESLERRIIETADFELLTKDSGSPLVRYKAGEGILEYEKSVDGDTSVPTPDEFAAQFNLLMRLSELNQKLNAL